MERRIKSWSTENAMIYLISDTHKQDIPGKWQRKYARNDIFIHLGDYELGGLPDCFRILVRGNHDKAFAQSKFNLVTEGLLLPGDGVTYYLTHEPVERLPRGCHYNVCGHMHDSDWLDYGFVRKKFHILLEPNRLYSWQEVIDATH